MDIIRIYGLLDPDTREVRYIGKTGRELKNRHREHITDLKDNSHKVKWIKKLKTSNKLPIIELIEECNELNWSEREKYWITQFTNLTNSTDGGEDGKHTKETIDKLECISVVFFYFCLRQLCGTLVLASLWLLLSEIQF